MPATEHLYLVAYDISDDKRWRRIFKLMNGYGEWLQLSIFQCRLSRRRHIELIALIEEIILNGHDHVIVMDLGPADSIDPKVVSIGKEFAPVAREPIII